MCVDRESVAITWGKEGNGARLIQRLSQPRDGAGQDEAPGVKRAVSLERPVNPSYTAPIASKVTRYKILRLPHRDTERD